MHSKSTVQKLRVIGGKLLLIGAGLFLLLHIACNNGARDKAKEVSGEGLVLTANESFFAPVGTLRAHLRDKTSGNSYNKHEYYDYIHQWKNTTDTVLFALRLEKEGTLVVQTEMQLEKGQDKAELELGIADQKRYVNLKPATSGGFELQDAVVFEHIPAGFHYLKLRLNKLSISEEGIGKLGKVLLSGTAAEEAQIEMRRYRPFAVHCRWATESDAPVEISVHELTVMNRSVNCYQPITTPFGYTGSPWSLDLNGFGGYNFSLWSYGAKDIPPPFYQESHLIAVGPELHFGAYGHEGTGVKPRGKNPFEGKNTNVQVIAVRKKPGKVYDTYWSYYWDDTDARWKLYGCGKKFNKKGTISYLNTGAFVEVAGPASKERSGHVVRETQYRGWQMDTEGNWHPITKMIGTSRPNNESFRDWRRVGNKFSMRMGGFGSLGVEATTIEIPASGGLPEFLSSEAVRDLYAMPVTFGTIEVKPVAGGTQGIRVLLPEPGNTARGTIYWGTRDGLTKEKAWEFSKDFDVIPGENLIAIPEMDPGKSYFYRIKVANEKGIAWNYNTLQTSTD